MSNIPSNEMVEPPLTDSEHGELYRFCATDQRALMLLRRLVRTGVQPDPEPLLQGETEVQRRRAIDEAYDLLTCARPAEHLEGATDEEWYAARAQWYARNSDAEPKAFGVLGKSFGDISGEAANAQSARDGKETVASPVVPDLCTCPYRSATSSLITDPICPVHGHAAKAAGSPSEAAMQIIAAVCHSVSGTCCHVLKDGHGPCTIENCSAVRGYLGAPNG